MDNLFQVFKERIKKQKEYMDSTSLYEEKEGSLVFCHNVLDYKMHYTHLPLWSEQIYQKTRENMMVIHYQNHLEEQYHAIKKVGNFILEACLMVGEENEPWEVTTALLDVRRDHEKTVVVTKRSAYYSFEKAFLSHVFQQPHYRLLAATGELELLNREITNYL